MIEIFSDEVIEHIDTVLNISASTDCRFPFKNEVRQRMATILMWREINSEIQKEIDDHFLKEMIKEIHRGDNKHFSIYNPPHANFPKRKKHV